MSGSIGSIVASVLTAVLKIALLVGVGCKLEVQGMLNGPKRKCLSALAMDVCLPCLLFSSVLPEADLKLFHEGWQLLLWPLVYAIVGSVIGAACCIAVGIPMQHLGSAAACAAFPNVNGFPISIITALGPTLPKSPAGFSPLTFLALIQLTDGCVKYTLGPIVFRRDLRAVQAARIKEGMSDQGDLPLGASLVSIVGDAEAIDIETPPPDDAGTVASMPPSAAKRSTSGQLKMAAATSAPAVPDGRTEFGLAPEQFRAVEPEWSRFDAGKLAWSSRSLLIEPIPEQEPVLAQPLLGGLAKAGNRIMVLAGSSRELVSQLLPPQVVAVLLALAVGLGPEGLRPLFYDPQLTKAGGQPYLAFVYGTAKQLGGGFVPLQMISLGGRLVNIVGPSGPLADKGVAGPKGRTKLLKVSAAVGFARMCLAPAVCYLVALTVDRVYLHHTRPLAFWAPALIVSAMPTANNMSTMADLVGSGRSISAASTAMQLVASPVILALTLAMLIAGAQYHLADDFVVLTPSDVE